MKYTHGIGYFETLFSAIEIDVLAKALKEFALHNSVSEKSNQGEVLNEMVATLFKVMDYEAFQNVASELFQYPVERQQQAIEVVTLRPSESNYDYLKKNIQDLLVEETTII
ncbi:hypothetical protein [Streptococcus constellatus]|uniref:Uncharacterized protein n=1 Tax=Streptococcus constellatus TaxID=76860 RepID=A0A0C1K635_STRCV|nr:hypothetical protein [Streptococcus constellatus]KIC78490.1 hypothetical protein RN79_02680 [Streptococcus constellatus]